MKLGSKVVYCGKSYIKRTTICEPCGYNGGYAAGSAFVRKNAGSELSRIMRSVRTTIQ